MSKRTYVFYVAGFFYLFFGIVMSCELDFTPQARLCMDNKFKERLCGIFIFLSLPGKCFFLFLRYRTCTRGGQLWISLKALKV